MPRVYSRNGLTRTIEMMIPARDTTEDLECHICSKRFCERRECIHSATSMACCDQPVCVCCLYKVSKRCRCTHDCDAVIAFCPYCREMSPVSSLDIFMGSKDAECPDCELIS